MKKAGLFAALVLLLGGGYFAVTNIGHQTVTPVTQAATGRRKVAASPKESVEILSFKDTQGQNVTVNPNEKTVLHFLTTSCSSCLPMETTLSAFAHTPGVRLISIDVDSQSDSVGSIDTFKKAVGATWPYVMDQNQSLVQKFHITSLDTVVVLYHGQVIYSGVAPSKSTLEKVL